MIEEKSFWPNANARSQLQIDNDQRCALQLFDLAIDRAKLAGVEPAELLVLLLRDTPQAKLESPTGLPKDA